MAELTKHGRNDTRRFIGHNLRQIPPGKKYRNRDLNMNLSGQNYSLINRGKTTGAVNAYRLQIEKEIFHYNRSNLVHSVEVVYQLPDDCPPEQEKAFFQECLNYTIEGLPMGERCVFLAEVHKDEHKIVDGIDISKPHMHVMYVPAAKDSKHDGFEYKLCADALTKKAALKAFHPGLQKHLDDCGIKATVYRKKEGSGKTISLSVKQLKEITEKTGIVLKKSITVDRLVEILKANREIVIRDKTLIRKLDEYERNQASLISELDERKKAIQEKDVTIEKIIEMNRSNMIKMARENTSLREQLSQAHAERQHLMQRANQIISEKDSQIEAWCHENELLRAHAVELSDALDKSRKQILALSKDHKRAWTNGSSWGTEQKKEVVRPW